MTSRIETAAAAIRGHSNLFAFIGAGFSEESGLRTFRGAEGVLDKATKQFMSCDAMRTQRDSSLEFHEEFHKQVREAKPNRGHDALASIAEDKTVVAATQNIDGLFEKSCGNAATIFYLHGRLDRVKCHECRDYVRPKQTSYSDEDPCEWCGKDLMRPDVVLYGEPLPDDTVESSLQNARMCDVCLILGASGKVAPANRLPEEASQNGAICIEVNPIKTDLSSVADITLRGKTGTVLPDLAEELGYAM